MLSCLNENSGAIQAFAAIAIVFLTGALVGITAWYAKTTRDALNLSREQMDRLQRVYIEFGLVAIHGDVLIWVANLGACSVLVSAVRIRQIGKAEVSSLKINSVVQAGDSARLEMPSGSPAAMLSKSFEAMDVSLVCVSSGEQQQSKWRAFTLYRMSPGTVGSIKSGIHDLWPVTCPRCNESDFMVMVTDGLDNFDEAFARQKLTEEHLATTCPNHSSVHLHGNKPTT